MQVDAPVTTRCAAKNKRNGKPCGNPPMNGSTVCRMHGGKAPQTLAKAAARLDYRNAQQTVARLGLPVDIHPGEALLEEVRRSAGHVRWLAAHIGNPDDTGPLVVQGRPSAWWTIYERERDHLADVSAKTMQAGVEERRIRIAEADGARLAERIGQLVTDLDLHLDNPAVEQAVRRFLTDL